MVDLSHWDFEEYFTAEQIAALILGIDPSSIGFHRDRVDPVLRRIDRAYRDGLRKCIDRHSALTTTVSEYVGNDLVGTFVTVLEQQVKRGTVDIDVFTEIEGLWDRFGDDQFSRQDVASWLSSNGLQSKYAFVREAKVKAADELTDKPLSDRERTSYLNIIGALLAQLTAGRANDTTVIAQALMDYSAKQGISERKLQQTFAAAKRSLDAS